MFQLLTKVKGSATDVMKALKEVSVMSFAVDTLVLEALLDGLKSHLRSSAGTLDAESLKTVQNNLRMLMAFKNFKAEVDPILAKLCTDYVDRQHKLAQTMKRAGL